MFVPIKVNWLDKIDKQNHAIQLDISDLKLLAKKLKVETHEVKEKLDAGKVVETELHSYQVI